ncbi:PREDICTED: uncharacterized protein LOC105557015 [Vollenhovia emeryi]|uniref:uncharacterized protein LOC105557015 n=1 Tax=Vollenhovia emeryi TaxID=411798 RepID=UPI0005F45341|nr:PREDICTED: uncharacterized protein LOC105557015 [Vollenhovia emeryi]
MAVGKVLLCRGELEVSVTLKMWDLEHRTFVMRRFYANGESVTQTQRGFRRHFNVPPRGPIPDRNTILRWMQKPRTLPELKEAIRREIQAIPREMLQDSMRNFRERLETCVQSEGHHLRDVIFAT